MGFFLLVSLFSGGVLLWGLSTRTMPVAPFWVEREKNPILYWSTGAVWALFCIGFLIAAI